MKVFLSLQQVGGPLSDVVEMDNDGLSLIQHGGTARAGIAHVRIGDKVYLVRLTIDCDLADIPPEQEQRHERDNPPADDG